MSTPGLRERKKIETRTALRAAALALSIEHGPDAITVEQVCDRAHVGRRTFFNYFTSKDDAIVGWSDDHLDQIRDAIAAEPADVPAAVALARVVDTILRASAENAVWRAQLDLVRVHPEVAPRMLAGMQLLETALTDGLADRPGAPDALDCRLLATVACSVLRVAVRAWMGAPDGPEPADRFHELFTRLAAGPLLAGLTEDDSAGAVPV